MRIRSLIDSLRTVLSEGAGKVIGHTKSGKPVYGPSAALIKAYDAVDQQYGTGATDFDAIKKLGAEARKLIQAHIKDARDYSKQDHLDASNLHGEAWFKTRSHAERTAHKALGGEHELAATGKRPDPYEGFGSIRSSTRFNE